MSKLLKILKEQFGFEQFRAGQLEAICALLKDDRLLCIQPTGHGKSLLYQLPAVVLNDMTLVISPLLALMRDQILHLSTRFNIAATSINSDQTDEENYNAKEMVTAGQVKILFVAPEQLDNIDKFNFLLSLPISLIVIDEAHCISTWGHDFRPSYRQIMQLVQNVEKNNSALKVLGLTATANHKTEADIKEQLSTTKPVQIHRANMDRPNIQLINIQITGLADKLVLVNQMINKLKGDGLIYCATRENTEIAAEFCQSQNINGIAYHAGIDAAKKRLLQTNFINGKYKVIAATNALGMGIDKPDLRFIIHFDTPGSITAYYQEIGRVGRDGLPSKAILLFDKQDKKIQQHFINSAQPSIEDFHNILDTVMKYKNPLPLMSIKRMTGMHPTKVTVIVAELLEQNLLQKIKFKSKQCYEHTKNTHTPDLTRYTNQYEAKTKELAKMLDYGEQKSICRMLILRQALGDDKATPCGHCDICIENNEFVKPQPNQTVNVDNWLTARVAKIKTARINNISEGISILDGKLRSPLFVQFMRQRANKSANMGLSSELVTLLKAQLNILKLKHDFAAVVAIPSRTWNARNAITKLIATHLKVPFLDILQWRIQPSKRQGELLNNDQRRYNVDKKMTIASNAPPPNGAILLLDDYTGSGATIKEAARALRKNYQFTKEIVPFTIATVKWRLGKAGMI